MNTIYIETHHIYNKIAYKMSLKYNFDPYENSSLIMCIILPYDIPHIIIKKLAVYLNSLGYNYLLESKKLLYNKEIIHAIKPFLDSQNIKYEIKIHNQSKL